MEDLMNLDFEVMWRDNLVGHVIMEDGELILNEDYSKRVWENPFRKIRTGRDARACLQDRVICPERFDEEMQKAFGFKEWDVLKILKDTHGVSVDDFTWLKFRGESIEWKDVKVRD